MEHIQAVFERMGLRKDIEVEELKEVMRKREDEYGE
jgi:hypothetical protein